MWHLLLPSEVLIAVFTGDNIVLTRTQAAWDTWIRAALDFGFCVEVLAQTAREAPFPVVGAGGGEANGPGQIVQMWNGYSILASRHPQARWILKCDDDSYVNVRSLWRLLSSSPLSRQAEADSLWFGGDCEHFCGGGSGLLMSRVTLAGLVQLRQRGHNCTNPHVAHGSRRSFVGSDTTTSACVTRALGGKLSNHEGFYWWPPQRSNATAAMVNGSALAQLPPGTLFQWAGHTKASGDPQRHRIGVCSAMALGEFIVADGWVTYHHVKPVDMVALHRAVTAFHGASAGRRGSYSAEEGGRGTSDGSSASCIGPLSIAAGQAFRRCEGLLCPPKSGG